MKTTIKELKAYCRENKLKLSGNKAVLIDRVTNFKTQRHLACTISNLWRIYIYRKWKQLHNIKGEYTNETDFFSLQKISEISNRNLFVIVEHNKNFAFEMVSFYHLIKGSKVSNPYNRIPLDLRDIERFNKLILYTKWLRIPLDFNIEAPISIERSMEFRILALFQTIEEHGFYTNPQWFYELSSTKLIHFISALRDIWNYRAGISIETKRLICPPNGVPFRNYDMFNIQIENIKEYVVSILEQFVHSTAIRSDKFTGICFVLQALTLVSTEAAESLPWLYESVSDIDA